MNIKLNKILSYFILIFPIALITGPLIPEIILFIVSILINFQIIKNKNFNFYKSKFTYFFLIFWIYLILNSFFAENSLWSLRTSLFYFRYYLFSISILYLISNGYLKLKIVSLVLLIIFSILIIDIFTQYKFGTNLLGFTVVENRYSGMFGDELILGSYLAKIFPLLLSLSLINNNNYNKLFLLYIFCPLLFFAIILTGERTASMLSLLFIIFSSLIIIKSYQNKFFYSFSIILIFAVIMQLNPSVKKRFIDETLNYIIESRYSNIIKLEHFDNNEKNDKIYIFSKLHHGHYISAYKLFLETPTLGKGVNSFRNNCKKFNHEYSCSTHPHNIPLQILSELGLIGFMFYLILLVFFLKILFSKKNHTITKILSLGLIIYLFPLSPSGNFFNNWMSMIFYFLVGFFLASMRYNPIPNDK